MWMQRTSFGLWDHNFRYLSPAAGLTAMLSMAVRLVSRCVIYSGVCRRMEGAAVQYIYIALYLCSISGENNISNTTKILEP